jgi:HK97 family phage portal protein
MGGFFATILGAAPASGKRSTTSWAPDDDRWFQADAGGRGGIGRNVTAETAMQFSAWYAGCALLATTIAALPLQMYARSADGTESTYAPNHPINDLIEYQPNRWQTAFDFKSWLMYSILHRGNGYAEIISGPRGFADSLEPIHPDRVNCYRGDDNRLRYKIASLTPGNPDRILLDDEILHLRGPHAPGIVGISPIAYARQTIGLGLDAEEHGRRTFNSGARPSGVVTVPKTLSDPAFERFKQDWGSQYNGLTNVGKTPILEDGATFEAITMKNSDTQFLESRQFQIEEVCRWLNVPPVMIHHMNKTTTAGSGIEQILLSYVRTSILPWTSIFTGAIRRDLILVPRQYEARFDIESLIRGDSKAQADFFSRLVLNGILTRNEARDALGYNPLPGLSEPLTPSNTNTSDNAPGNGGDQRDDKAQIGQSAGPALIEDHSISQTEEGPDK